jgi:DNA-binding CsgD family transcriptional regulator
MKTASDAFERIGMPACIVNQHGRIVEWNGAAADFFRLSGNDVLGHEWHSIITTVNTPGCCALCKTRRTLREGSVAMPIEVTLSVAGYQQRVTMMPLPVTLDPEEALGFVVLHPGSTGKDAASVRGPVSIQSRVRHLSDDRIIDELTMREREILACVVHGYDARGIAAQVGISHATARNYVQRILSKLGARNKAEAVNLALSYNLLAS